MAAARPTASAPKHLPPQQALPKGAPKDTRWVTAEALLTLGAIGIERAGQKFTAGDLSEWTRLSLTPSQRVNASTRLCALGFVSHKVAVLPDDKTGSDMRTDLYTLTAEGAEAVKAAVQGHVRKSGPKGQRRSNPIDEDTLSRKLWDLMRMRRMLTSASAAATLADAGCSADDYRRLRSSAQRYLRRWTDAGALTVADKRVHEPGMPPTSNGLKRYVLISDSVAPPSWYRASKAKAGTA
jgi:hypothetical protein